LAAGVIRLVLSATASLNRLQNQGSYFQEDTLTLLANPRTIFSLILDEKRNS